MPETFVIAMLFLEIPLHFSKKTHPLFGGLCITASRFYGGVGISQKCLFEHVI